MLLLYVKKKIKLFTQEFKGNTDWGTVVFHELQPPIRTRYIRFQPLTWHGHISMRVELYGCIEGTVQHDLGQIGKLIQS